MYFIYQYANECIIISLLTTYLHYDNFNQTRIVYGNKRKAN